MRLEHVLHQIEAAADPTRLRLLALLADGEAAVGELTEVLAQSQPRVSRHLRLLTEAGLIENLRESRRVYYRLTPSALEGGLHLYVGALRDGADPTIARDRAAMAALRGRRVSAVLKDPVLRPRGVGAWPEADLADALDEVLGDSGLGHSSLGEVLDVGCGSGALLRLLGPRAQSVTGLDTAPAMRELARAGLHRSGLARCSVRHGDAHELPFPDDRFDVVVLDEVLGASARPFAVIAEAARVIRPGGRLVILDRVLPAVRRLPGDAAGDALPALYENQVSALLRAYGFTTRHRRWLPGRSPDRAVISAVPERVVPRSVTRSGPSATRTGTDG